MTETITIVSLADLSLSRLNPRQHVSEADIAALAGSIRTVGLLQNLAGIADEDGKVQIVAGGRRLRALQSIAEADGVDPATVQVQVMLAVNEAEAQAWASTENIARTALHPADEVRAYRDMTGTGAAPETIASAFGVTVRHVKGRLRLANLPEPILEALAQDEITLDVAAAYTVSDDAGLQAQVFETVRGSWMANTPREIKARLMREAGSAEHRLARFVGRVAYAEAGGVVREDLFGEDVWFLDPDLLSTLAEAKLEAVKMEIIGEGWAWVDAAFERPDWQVLETYARTYTQQAEASDEDIARYDELAELIETGDASEDDEDAFEALAERLDAEHWSEEQHQHAGAILWVGHDGAVSVERGLVAKADRKAAEAAGLCQPSRHGVVASKPKGPYPAALMRDLAKVRTGAAQAALMAKPDLALDILAFILSQAVYADQSPVAITAQTIANTPDEDSMAGAALPEALTAHSPHPLTAGGAAAAFEAFRSLPKKARMEALGIGVARSIAVGLDTEDTANPFAETILRLAKLDVRSRWTPERRFLARLPKARLLDIHDEIMEQPAARERLAKSKKVEIVERLHTIFTGDGIGSKLAKAQKERADAWLPEGMAVAKPSVEEPVAIAAE